MPYVIKDIISGSYFTENSINSFKKELEIRSYTGHTSEMIYHTYRNTAEEDLKRLNWLVSKYKLNINLVILPISTDILPSGNIILTKKVLRDFRLALQ